MRTVDGMRGMVGAVVVAVLVVGGCGGDQADNASSPGEGNDDRPAAAASGSPVTTPGPPDTTAPPETSAPTEVPDSTDPCAAAGIEVDGCADFAGIDVATDGDQIVISGPEGSRSITPSDAVAELGGEVTDTGISVPLPDSVLFDFGSVALRGPSREKISLVAGLAKASPEAEIDIGGHTDAIGTPDFNQRLSEARAGVVREALVILGVERDRISATGFGESRPVAPNSHPGGSDNPTGRQRNRRVEILLAGAQV